MLGSTQPLRVRVPQALRAPPWRATSWLATGWHQGRGGVVAGRQGFATGCAPEACGGHDFVGYPRAPRAPCLCRRTRGTTTASAAAKAAHPKMSGSRRVVAGGPPKAPDDRRQSFLLGWAPEPAPAAAPAAEASAQERAALRSQVASSKQAFKSTVAVRIRSAQCRVDSAVSGPGAGCLQSLLHNTRAAAGPRPRPQVADPQRWGLVPARPSWGQENAGYGRRAQLQPSRGHAPPLTPTGRGRETAVGPAGRGRKRP